MNRLITLFGFLLMTTMMLAQGTISITLTGTVTDVDGNGISNVDVNIVVDSTGIPDYSYYNIVPTNEDGTYSDTFEVPEALSQGAVYAWIENCNNGYVWGESSWFPGGDPVIDFVYCNINCSVGIIDTLGTYLYAEAEGEAPFSYLWNTGETTFDIIPTQSGTYCVVTTDNNGCEANDCIYFDLNVIPDTLCAVVIYEDSASVNGILLTAIPSGTAPFSYLWDVGLTTPSIIVPGSGEYCLSVIDATGCVTAACYDVDNSCNETVFITQNDTELTAVANIIGEIDYAWSNGANTQATTATSAGPYCVTITYSEGCQAFDCLYFMPDTTFTDSCFVNLDLVQNGAWLQATTGGVAPFTYEWSNGSTSNSIEITEDTLCVTITDAVGCVASGCYATFEVPLVIQGHIFVDSEDSSFLNAVVDLFSLDEEGANFMASVASDGYYRFDDVAAGNYIVRAVVDGYLPTYHLSSEWWDEATIITPSPNDNQWYEIQLIDVDGLVAGPGGITGTASEPDGFGGHDDNNRDFEPIEGAEIILFNSENEAVAYTWTNADGDYAFADLAYGTYAVYIEIVGYEQVFYTITLSPDNELANNINFIVDIDNTMIATATRAALLDENLLTIFPNPVKGTLKMNLNIELAATARVELMNITGQIIFRDTFSQYEQQKSIDVSGLNLGLYLLKVTTENGIIVQQFVKQ